MQVLVTIGSGVLGRAGVEFSTFPLTDAVVLKTLAPNYQPVIVGLETDSSVVWPKMFRYLETFRRGSQV